MSNNHTKETTYIPDRGLQITLYSLVCSVCFLSNTLLFLVLGLNRRLHTKTNLLLANLGLTDWLVAIFGITINVVNLSTNPIDKGTACKITGFFVLVPFLATNLGLALIALHRYILIVRNKTYAWIFSNFKMGMYILIVWGLSILMAVPPFFGWGCYNYIHDRSHCMIDWRKSKSYLFFIQIIAFPIPLTIMLFSYYKVFKHSYASWRRLQASSDKHNMAKKKRELSLTVTLLIVVILYFVLNMPYAILIYMEGIFDIHIPPEQSFASMLLAYCNSMCDFWIYAVMSKKFRSSFFSLMKSCVHPKKRMQIVPAPTYTCGNKDAMDDVSSSATQLFATPELSARRRSVMDPAAGGAFYKSVHSEIRNNSIISLLPSSQNKGNFQNDCISPRKLRTAPIFVISNHE